MVSEGLVLLVGHIRRLLDDARSLGDAGRLAGAEIMAGFASEEAAKVFILLDYARAGLADGKPLALTTSHFYDHLARRIYATEYAMSPANFAEVVEFTQSLRLSRVLDGPEGFEFEYGNSELSPRELLLYVDFISVGGTPQWSDPADQWVSGHDVIRSASGDLALSMCRAGLFEPDSLTAIADIWTGVKIEPKTHWQEIRARNVAVLTSSVVVGNRQDLLTERDLNLVADRWGFPLWATELDLIRVNDVEIETARLAAQEAYLRDFNEGI